MENEKIIPKHVGIIMDGNGRWAKKRGLIRSLGHKAGADNLDGLMRHIYETGVEYISLYAFSTENFKRDKEEVDYLMNLFVNLFTSKRKKFVEKKIKVIVSGRRDNLREDLQKAIHDTEEATKDFEGKVVNFCLNYGGRPEIIDMVKKVSQMVKDGKINIDDIDEELVNENMYQDLPPLDFVIRTSGEMRISNFMLWQSSYAEFYFPETYFPDFDGKEFDKALEEFARRNRRFGGQ